MKSELRSLCSYAKGKVSVDTLSKRNYVSTENMLPNKGGIVDSGALPSAQYTQQYIKGDILVSNIRPYFKKIWMADDDGGCSNDVLVFRAERACDSTFLYYVLANDEFFNYASATAKGTKMPRGDKTAIMQYEVPCFDLETQLRIGKLLRSIDYRIAINKKINDNLEQQAMALFHAYFPYAPTDDVPTDWRICALSDVTENIRTRVKNQNCTVLSAVNAGKLQPSEEYFTKQVFSKDISNYIVVEENSFAYNPARVNIGSIGINNLGFLGCVSPVYVVFRVEEDYQYFFDFFIKTPRFREEVRTRASGSVRQAMNYSDFGLIPIAYPPKSVIDNFNRLYLPIYHHIEHRKEENTRLAELRDNLLPRLMSGEIDVSDIQL